MTDKGILIGAIVDNPDARFDIKTKQGALSFAARELPYGKTMAALDGRVRIHRVPGTMQLTSSEEDEDFPTIAQSGDDV